jgi:hypothetical protein
MAARSPALHLINAQIYVRVALKMISVETFLMKIHPEFHREWNYTISPKPSPTVLEAQFTEPVARRPG